MVASLSLAIFEALTKPGARLPWLEGWLLNEIWSPERYSTLGPVEYLTSGEREVNRLEELLCAAACRVYEELTGEVGPERDLRAFLTDEKPTAAVVFDGLSLREIPTVRDLAERSGLQVIETGVSFAALPSDTRSFIDQRLGIGMVAPTQLSRRRDLREAGITPYCFDTPSQRHRIDFSACAILLWHLYPDRIYKDSGARFPEHFEAIRDVLEAAWIGTVQQIPSEWKILITSDHGYIYFGHGLSLPRTRAEVRPLAGYLGGQRFKHIEATDPSRPEHPDLAVIPARSVAIIRGRVQTHFRGPASSQLYKHGGLSLMEMLTPWIVLKAS